MRRCRIKSEARILVTEYFDSNAILYAVLRGIKGIEHVGLVGGDTRSLKDELRKSHLLDEIRYIILPDGSVVEVHGSNLREVLDDGVRRYLVSIANEVKEMLNMIRSELKFIIGKGNGEVCSK